jgi:CheY-like chemotaxis protein
MPESCVLIVDDHQDDVFLLQRALQSAGFNRVVRSVNDAGAAIQYLGGMGAYAEREKHPEAKLVLLDLHLGPRSGMEVLEWLSKQPTETRAKVIVLTGSMRPGDIARAYTLGASGFILKPHTADKAQELARMLKSWVEFNQFG